MEFGREIGLDAFVPLLLRCENHTAIRMAKESRMTDASKHRGIYYHYVRDFIIEGKLVLLYIASEENTEDLLMKGLGREAHEKLSYAMVMPSVDGLVAEEECWS